MALSGEGMIEDFRLWGSRRWRRGGVRLTNVGPDTRAGHEFNYDNASLSEAKPSPLWSKASPKRRTGSGTTRISCVGCNNRGGAVPGASLPRPARRTGGVLVVGATPGFSALVRHERGQGRTGLRTPFPPRSGVAPTTVIPGGKAIERCSGLRRSTRAGQVAGPLIHEPAPALEQVRAGVGCLDRVADHMRHGRLNDFTRVVRLQPLGNAGHGAVPRRCGDEPVAEPLGRSSSSCSQKRRG